MYCASCCRLISVLMMGGRFCLILPVMVSYHGMVVVLVGIVHLASSEYVGYFGNALLGAEKTEAIDQCPGWIVLAVQGTYTTDSAGGKSCWHTVEASKPVIRKPPGAWLDPCGVDFHPTGGGDIPSIIFL